MQTFDNPRIAPSGLHSLVIALFHIFIFLSFADTIVEDDEDVPELVDNFDAPSKNESRVGDADGMTRGAISLIQTN